MHSIQYPITLPRNFAMRELEERAASKAGAFEALSGLQLKAFLVTSIKEGAADNRYAPFYIWHNAFALREFLAGSLFQGVVERFGRPAVHLREVLEFGVADRSATPHIATFEELAAEPDAKPIDIWRQENSRHREALRTPGLHSAAALLDTASWRVTRVRLWANAESIRDVAADARHFRVLRAVGPAVSATGLESFTD